METNGNWRNCAKEAGHTVVNTRCREWAIADDTCLQVEAGTTGFTNEDDKAKYGAYVRIVNISGKFDFTPVFDNDGKCIGIVMRANDKNSAGVMDFALRFCSDTLYEQNTGYSREKVMFRIAKALLERKEGETAKVDL